MLTITAIIRARAGHEETMQRALLEVAAHVQANEPETVGFYVARDAADPCVFTTYERFADQAAMDRHNGSAATAAFFAIAKPLLDGAVTLLTCTELSAKP
jgi:quinol monooxygenase YgiN